MNQIENPLGFNKDSYASNCRNILNSLLNIPLFTINPYNKDLEWFQEFINRPYVETHNPTDEFKNYFISVITGEYEELEYNGVYFSRIPFKNKEGIPFMWIKESNFRHGGIIDEGNKGNFFNSIHKFERHIRKQTKIDSQFNKYPIAGETYLYGYKIKCIDDWKKARPAYRFFTLPSNDAEKLVFLQDHMTLVRHFSIRYILRYPVLFTPLWKGRYLFSDCYRTFEDVFENEFRTLFEKLLNDTILLNINLKHLDIDI